MNRSALIRYVDFRLSKAQKRISIFCWLGGIVLLVLAIAHYFSYLNNNAKNLGAIFFFLFIGIIAEILALKLKNN